MELKSWLNLQASWSSLPFTFGSKAKKYNSTLGDHEAITTVEEKTLKVFHTWVTADRGERKIREHFQQIQYGMENEEKIIKVEKQKP